MVILLSPGSRHSPKARRRPLLVAYQEVSHVEAISLCVVIDYVVHGVNLLAGVSKEKYERAGADFLKKSFRFVTSL